ncbi:GNAT family N-acetyltransferase [Chitinimonas sp.]|uniref:GNAT family N-acetyltransferase n=1 Tax=Chitinimonas sp. TaxID=1934313 RepID=UPI0035AF0306
MPELHLQHPDFLLPSGGRIRPIDAGSDSEIALVATRMRDTLIEVEGEAQGIALHTLDWLEARVRWHLDRNQTLARVYLAETEHGEITGHCIVREELDAQGCAAGLIAALFVVPSWRKQSVANQLLLAGEAWCRSVALQRAATWTTAANLKLIRLFARHGYGVVDRQPHPTTGTAMIQLAKSLDPS